MQKSEFPDSIRAEIAFSDCLMVGYSTLLFGATTDPNRLKLAPSYEKQSIESIFAKKTKGKCVFGSAYALHHLLHRYQAYFPYHAILVGFKNMSFLDPEVKDEGEFTFSNFNFHAYLLTCDRQGIWRAGSPANYDRGGKDSRVQRSIASPDIDRVLAKISQLDGGIWPDAQRIKYASFIEPYELRRNKGQIKEFRFPMIFPDKIDYTYRLIRCDLSNLHP